MSYAQSLILMLPVRFFLAYFMVKCGRFMLQGIAYE